MPLEKNVPIILTVADVLAGTMKPVEWGEAPVNAHSILVDPAIGKVVVPCAA